MAYITISQRQTPCFRALIKAESDGALFNKDTQLATQSELTTEGLTNAHPISYSVFKTSSNLYYTTTGEATPITGFQNVEIGSECLIDPSDVESGELDYNFSFTPEARASWPFAEPGVYFVDFMIYPKEGAAIVWREWLTVQ